jgi:GDPmannose 4,6-dehydratase
MWLMQQQPTPDDYVLATGESHSVREFVEFAFAQVGRKITWQGTGGEEVGIDDVTGLDLVRVDRRYFRPTEVDTLLGDATKARQVLGWRPETSFVDLVAEMVKSDLKVVAAESERKDRGSY